MAFSVPQFPIRELSRSRLIFRPMERLTIAYLAPRECGARTRTETHRGTGESISLTRLRCPFSRFDEVLFSHSLSAITFAACRRHRSEAVRVADDRFERCLATRRIDRSSVELEISRAKMSHICIHEHLFLP